MVTSLLFFKGAVTLKLALVSSFALLLSSVFSLACPVFPASLKTEPRDEKDHLCLALPPREDQGRQHGWGSISADTSRALLHFCFVPFTPCSGSDGWSVMALAMCRVFRN